MKISKLFHWLYAILMLLPIGLLVFNMLHGLFSPSATSIDFSTFMTYLNFSADGDMFALAISTDILNVYDYLVSTVFGLSGYYTDFVVYALTYWTCISIIWLVFDVLMYVPLLVHRWIDKAKME